MVCVTRSRNVFHANQYYSISKSTKENGPANSLWPYFCKLSILLDFVWGSFTASLKAHCRPTKRTFTDKLVLTALALLVAWSRPSAWLKTFANRYENGRTDVNSSQMLPGDPRCTRWSQMLASEGCQPRCWQMLPGAPGGQILPDVSEC